MSAIAGDMTFLDHLDELRRRIVFAILALVLSTAACYFFFEQIIELVKWPLPHNLKVQQLKVPGLMQFFMFRFKLAVIGGFIFSSPFIIYQILAFLAPAMKKKERKYIFLVLPFLCLLFFGGVAFSFFVVLPTTITWLQAQGAGQVDLLFIAEDYVNFVSLFALGFGVAFEAPLVIVLLIKLGIVDRKSLRKNWRIAYVACFVIAAIATPDWSVVSMMALGITLLILFELSMLFTRWL